MPTLFRLMLLPLLLLPPVLSGCASPCQRIDDEMRQLNADTIRDPAMAGDGRYLARFQELAAQSVEKGCLSGGRR
ncbi:hypothetical protein [Niveispirillum sp. KHB5.9]|uniref:hypothetical protein n=1 Tax=Niveispirillum sp. KHB5.9 TaxID=3400269 RepID=UPI003A8B396E